MTAEIIPLRVQAFEPSNPQEYTIEMMHLDLTAQWLNDRGWKASAGSMRLKSLMEEAYLTTNAPNGEVHSASESSYETLFEFLAEECDHSVDEIPNKCHFTLLEVGYDRLLNCEDRIFRHL